MNNALLGRQYFDGILKLATQKTSRQFQNHCDCVRVLGRSYIFWLPNRVLFLSYFTFSSHSEYLKLLMFPDPTHLTCMVPPVVKMILASL